MCYSANPIKKSNPFSVVIRWIISTLCYRGWRCVFFYTQQKLNKGSISKNMSIMKDEDNNHSIIVYMDSITNMTSKSVDQSIEMKIELFCMNELQFNITKHRLQPAEFKVFTKQESRNFKIKFGQKLPKWEKQIQFVDFTIMIQVILYRLQTVGGW